MRNLIPMVKFIWVTIKHKIFVIKVGVKLKVSITRLLKHDLSKFSKKELPHYARNFYGSKNDPEGFSKCWEHHIRHNQHHPEHYVLLDIDKKEYVVRDMPEQIIREMVSDWLAATRSYAGYWPKDLTKWEWFQNNFKELRISKKTRIIAIKIIAEYFGYELVSDVSKKLMEINRWGKL